MKFGERLKQLRQEHELSLDEFAKIFNTYKSTIWRYENEQRQPPIDLVKRIAEYFNVSMDWLAGISNIRVFARDNILI